MKESIFVVQPGSWLYLFHLLINWTLFPSQHFYAFPILKLACIILSIGVITCFLEMHGLNFASPLKTGQCVTIIKYSMLYFVHCYRPGKLLV